MHQVRASWTAIGSANNEFVAVAVPSSKEEKPPSVVVHVPHNVPFGFSTGVMLGVSVVAGALMMRRLW